jgi:hypothetical protein
MTARVNSPKSERVIVAAGRAAIFCEVLGRQSMFDRLRKQRCGTCRYYRPCPLRGQGWCQHPRMNGNGASLCLVSSSELGCAHRMPVLWETADVEENVKTAPGAEIEE